MSLIAQKIYACQIERVLFAYIQRGAFKAFTKNLSSNLFRQLKFSFFIKVSSLM